MSNTSSTTLVPLHEAAEKLGVDLAFLVRRIESWIDCPFKVASVIQGIPVAKLRSMRHLAAMRHQMFFKQGVPLAADTPYSRWFMEADNDATYTGTELDDYANDDVIPPADAQAITGIPFQRLALDTRRYIKPEDRYYLTAETLASMLDPQRGGRGLGGQMIDYNVYPNETPFNSAFRESVLRRVKERREARKRRYGFSY